MSNTVTATRDKRSTAGKRMSSLVGEAQDVDEAFWGHDTWAEDDSDNASFRESDEDSEVRKDHFDSDFDESEDDASEQEAVAAGREEEAELQKQEKQENRKKTFDIAKAGRDLLQKKKGAKGRMKGQRVFGDGINAGLVLNMPDAMAPLHPSAPPVVRIKAEPVVTAAPTATTKPNLASTRMQRNRSKLLRTTTQLKSTIPILPNKPSKKGLSTKKSRAQYWTQEQLLLEAATVTESENERWLLGRKRLHDQAEAVIKLQESQQRNGKVISKFRSRRGMLQTLTFADMDAVPEILTRGAAGPPPKAKPIYCVITGKRANYKCPKTNKGYYDLVAFKELRRRLDAGEALDQRKQKDGIVAASELPNNKDAPATNEDVISSQPIVELNSHIQHTPTNVPPPSPAPIFIPPRSSSSLSSMIEPHVLSQSIVEHENPFTGAAALAAALEDHGHNNKRKRSVPTDNEGTKR